MDRGTLKRLFSEAVGRGVVPGGVVVVYDNGAPVWEHCFGLRATAPAPGPAVTADTVYDLASITKAAATTSVVMRLVEAGRLSLDTPARTLVPELVGHGKDAIRVRHLLSHSSGLPAWRPFFTALLAGEREPTPRDALLRALVAEPLVAEPGARSVYSDLGFILLGFMAERAGEARLDELARRTVFAPLGLSSMGFVDLLAGARRPAPVAPTELCPYRGLVEGEVHDDNCHAAGGILGHAGLFSTAGDLARLASALVASYHGVRVEGGFPREIVRAFWTPCGVEGSTWRHGWDGPAPEPGASAAGDAWPKEGVGHMGFTGTSLWIDPERSRFVVLLTNRVHPTRWGDERLALFRKLRRDVHETICR